jgi:hypothetical protein
MGKFFKFILCLMIFSFVLISDVSGLENNFEIVDISLKDKSGSISVSNPSINANSVVSNIFLMR